MARRAGFTALVVDLRLIFEAMLGREARTTDDGKRSEAEWTLYGDGIEERGVPGGEGTAIIPDTRPADR